MPIPDNKESNSISDTRTDERQLPTDNGIYNFIGSKQERKTVAQNLKLVKILSKDSQHEQLLSERRNETGMEGYVAIFKTTQQENRVGTITSELKYINSIVKKDNNIVKE